MSLSKNGFRDVQPAADDSPASLGLSDRVAPNVVLGTFEKLRSHSLVISPDHLEGIREAHWTI